MARTMRATAAQGATFVELFFDLVFVFAVTQVTATLHHDLTVVGLVRAVVIFWLIWWAWTQFTWTLNAADTEHTGVRFATLCATAVAFIMALTVPDVYRASAWWFSVSYILVRLIGIGGQYRVSSGDAAWHSAVRTWSLFSLLGLAAVAAAPALQGTLRTAALVVAIVVDIFAAERAGSGEWRLFPGHFGERHGLFVIIALGESLIAAGVAAEELPRDAALAAIVIPAVAAACALWWTYFGWAKDALERAMHQTVARERGWFARDIYSLGHFPIIGGVIGFAVAIEQAVEHPHDHLGTAAAVALAVGVTLFIGGVGLTLVRAGRSLPVVRAVVAVRAVVVVALLAAVPFMAAWPPTVALSIVAVAATVVAVVERNLAAELAGERHTA
jgi:low temperature requirement protein LtrA